MVLYLVKAVWKDKHVPPELIDAILIPIPKKGNLCCCDIWWGIALLDVMGKVVARVIQGRLQKLAKRVLPESQWFRRGCGLTDMIFPVQQLIEKAIKLCGWVVLSKLGVPQLLINIISSFHGNMKVRIHVKGELLEEIEVENDF